MNKTERLLFIIAKILLLNASIGFVSSEFYWEEWKIISSQLDKE